MRQELQRKAGLFLGWSADDPRWDALEHYLVRVRDAGVPLVSHGDRQRLIDRHLLPSLESLDLLPETGKLMDIGSGGGFPAFPIALAKSTLNVICVESNARKAAFLTRVSRETVSTACVDQRVDNFVSVLCIRVEDLPEIHNSTYDIVTARAVADLPELIRWGSRFLKSGGRFLFWKGRNWRSEGDIAFLNVRLIEERMLSDGGCLLVIERLP